MILDPDKLKEARGSMPRNDAAKAVGLTRQQVWHYEKGISGPPLPVLFKLLSVYRKKMKDVVTEEYLSFV